MHTAILEIRHPSGETELREMLQGTLSIGSEVGEILLADTKVSPSHALLRLQGMALTYTDVGSSGGSFVEDKRLTAPRTLAPGMSVMLGETELLLRGFGLKRTSRTEVTVKIHRSMFGLPPEQMGSAVTRPIGLQRAPTGRATGGPMPTLLARISRDGTLEPLAGGPAPAMSDSPLNALPSRPKSVATESPVGVLTSTSQSTQADPTPTEVQHSSASPLSSPAIEPPVASSTAPASAPGAIALGQPHPRSAADSQPSVAIDDDTEHFEAARRRARPRSHALEWTLLVGAAAAAISFFAWRGGYLTIPGRDLDRQAQTVPATPSPSADTALANTRRDATQSTDRRSAKRTRRDDRRSRD